MTRAQHRWGQATIDHAPSTMRAAVTLIEVLVSIFIMGIGLLALLTLFPLGALTMDQAIKADRAAACARNAYGTVAARNIRKDTALFTPRDAFTDPNPPPTNTPPWPAISGPPGAYRGPSYPVFVDPFGVLAVGTLPVGAMTGTFSSPGVPRRSVSFVAGAANPIQQALRWFSLLDDMDFKDGIPQAPGGAIQRSNRYTWALMLRRVGADEREWVEMAVVVYHSRPLQLPSGEEAYGPVQFDMNSPEVVVRYAGGRRPPIRKGGWVLDATVVRDGHPDPHGFFYRVVNVTDVGPDASGQPGVVIELETRPRKSTTQGVLVVMDNVLEVFDEGLGWKP